jgi:hypothetical protein
MEADKENTDMNLRTLKTMRQMQLGIAPPAQILGIVL